MVIGKIVDNWNEEKPGMVQVSFGLGKVGESQTGWIPVMMPYTGPSYGAYVLPETGTSVIVDFEQGNKNRPVVLGCIRSTDDTLPEQTANEDNSKKLWKSKQGYCVLVDEGEEMLSYSDPKGENTLSWSTKEKTMTVDIKEKLILKIGGEVFASVEKGKITLEGDVMVEAGAMKVQTRDDTTWEPGGSMLIKAGGDMTLKAANISLEPGQETVIKGTAVKLSPTQKAGINAQQINIEGTMVELKAKASLKAESSGMASVKGTMLQLN